MAIRIDPKLCVGCGACPKACPYEAIDLVDRKAILNDNCVHCGSCVDSCKFKAILASDTPAPPKDLSKYSGVLVFIETRGSSLAKVGLELLGRGRTLADVRGSSLNAVIIGSKLEPLLPELSSFGPDQIYVVDDPKLAEYTTGPFCRALTSVINQIHPEIVLIGASIQGRDLAPRVANRLKTGLTADCTELSIENESGLLLQTRPAFGGNVMATIVCPNHRPQMATVRPGVMKPLSPDPSRKAEIKRVKVTFKDSDLTVIMRETLRLAGKKVDLSEASVIVSGGRGVGGAAQFGIIGQLAEALGGQIGASRAAVEAGWVDHDHQVGQTGKSVSPKLYIACGISGAIQHLAGISGADFVIAVNRDPQAPILKRADIGIVGDLHQVIPVMIQEIKRVKQEAGS